jgi:hypothetical protein
MKGDFSRFTFSPEKSYDAVLTQQGRVTVDADANEQWAIADHRMRRTTADIIGPAGGPQDNAGFKITVAGPVLKIGAGLYYVDGLRCVNEAEAQHNAQPNLPAGAPVFHTLPAAPTPAPVAGRYLAYLDVWRRHITALEDPSIRETALTADTATRLKTLWQVRFVRLGNAGDAAMTCDGALAAWQALNTPANGTLAARAKAATPSTNPCAMPETAGYNRMENHLYRVEVHKSGKTGAGATFKWSRDNATLAVAWLASDGVKLTVSGVGYDRYSGFQNGQWVEATDDDRERRGEPGVLVRIKTVDGNVLTVDPATAEGPLAIAGFGANPKIRGWDGAGALPIAVPGSNDGFIEIENGLQVKFAAAADYRVGDYWLIPARSGVGVEWPQAGPNPKALSPHGIGHAYAKLAILDCDGTNWTAVGDCRKLFPPLTKLTSFFYLGGDGQEAMPNPSNTAALIPLGASLIVGVANCEKPVEGARVRFKVTAGNGRLTGGVAELVVATGPEGTASTTWSVDGATLHQHVVAELLDSADARRHLPIRFGASLSRAAEVSFDPANTPEISAAKTVQAAIEALYNRKGAGSCATYVLSPDADWAKILRELPKGEDAVICFRQGLYQAPAPIQIAGVRHLIIHGGGEATRVTVAKSEWAIEFVGCESVTVRDLAVEANETAGDWGPVSHLNGTLTMTDCASVEVSGCTLRCGASARAERTCLRVRITKTGQKVVPVRSVRIWDNRFDVGYGQLGLLVTDCVSSQIRDNQFQVQARPAGLTFENLLEEPQRRSRMAGQLVGTVTSGGRAAGTQTVEVGGFRVQLRNSALREGDVREMMKRNPAKAADMASADAVKKYLGRIADAEAKPAPAPPPAAPPPPPPPGRTQPALAARAGRTRSSAVTGATATGLLRTESAVTRHANLVRGAMGDAAFNALADDARRTLLLGEMEVSETAKVPGTTAVVRVGEMEVGLNSPIAQQDWNAIVRASPPATAPANARDARRYLQEMGRKLVRDGAFRDRFPSVKQRFGRDKENNPAVAAQAIVCAGGLSRDVQVTGNSIQNFHEGIHVAVSEKGEKGGAFSSLRSVLVADNALQLRVPLEHDVGRFGLMVGNAQRIRVSGNNLEFAEPRGNEKAYYHGIRIWGHLGPLMILRENHVSVGRIGLFVRHEGQLGKFGQQQWLAADNMVDAGGVILDAPQQVRDRDNAIF